MRIAFMGTPEFAVPALQALYQAGHEIVAVYCQPPRPAGRGRSLRPCAVQEMAEKLSLPVFYPSKLKFQKEEHSRFQSFDLDAAVIAAYGLILPETMLKAPKFGCINIHASLLPRWRGASPIQSAIWAGDMQSGISIMQMDKGLDTGPVFMTEATPITSETTAQELHDILSKTGSQLIVKTLEKLATRADFHPVSQPENGITYARQLNREDGRIDWTKSASEIHRQIRALTPWPGTFTLLHGQILKIISAKILKTTVSFPAGTIIDNQLSIVCGQGQILRLLQIQLAGKKQMLAQEFLHGRPIDQGTILGS